LSLPDLNDRPAYVALLWTGDPGRRAEALAAEIEVRWPLLRRQSGERVTVFTDPHQLGPCLVSRTGVLLGWTRDPRQADESLQSPASAAERAARLLGATWGRYVACFRDARSADIAILRDPSGALPAYLLDLGDLLLCASAMPRWLVSAAGITPRPDRERLAQALGRPSLATHCSLVEGVVTLPAGACYLRRPGSARQLQLWRPSDFAEEPVRAGEAKKALRASVDVACRSLGSRFGKLALELSGGLDSSIVLGSLASESTHPPITCVNFATAYREGNEREHARAAADRWNVPLLELQAAEHEMALDQIQRSGTAVEPMIYGMDFIQEQAMTQIVRQLGIDAIFTGQGGDAMFFQFPTIDVAIDRARAEGLRALASATAFDAARRTHTSIWSLWRRVLLSSFSSSGQSLDRFDTTLLGPVARAAAEAPQDDHPWLDGADRLPPGKRLQLETIHTCQIFYGPTHRAAVVPLIHPLLAQPVVETCLAIPSYELSRGTVDRALARETFTDRLPTSILHRRGKGEAGNYYGRAVVDSIPFLRSFLLDGTLVAHGLLDGEALDTLLEEDALLWSASARLPIVYAAFEAWARHWGL
jgi:asparagine synthase (glutamine-hydrolysing)